MKINKIIIVFLLLIPLALSGCMGNQGATGDAEKPNTRNEETKNIDEDSVAIEVIQIESETITKEYNTVGKLYASEEVSVSSATKGTVKSIKYSVGDTVKKVLEGK